MCSFRVYCTSRAQEFQMNCSNVNNYQKTTFHLLPLFLCSRISKLVSHISVVLPYSHSESLHDFSFSSKFNCRFKKIAARFMNSWPQLRYFCELNLFTSRIARSMLQISLILLAIIVACASNCSSNCTLWMLKLDEKIASYFVICYNRLFNNKLLITFNLQPCGI